MQSSSNSPVGYFSINEYIEKIENFEAVTGWRLPFGIKEKIQIRFLKLIVRWSWFSDRLYIEYPAKYWIGYDQLVNYLSLELVPIDVRRHKSVINTMRYFHWNFYFKSNEGTLRLLSLGTDLVDSVAFSKAIGEGLERYFTLKSEPELIEVSKICSYSNLTKNKKTLVYFPPFHHTYTEVQIMHNPDLYNVNNDPEIEWAEAKNLILNRKAYLPKQLLSYPSLSELYKKEGVMADINTSGGAGWFNKEGASYRGIFELIQRDAFMVSWLTEARLPAINVSEIKDREINKILSNLEVAKIEITILLADSAANIPTVLVVAVDKGLSEEQVYVTAHTDMTLIKAIKGALEELLLFPNEKHPYKLPDEFKPFITNGIRKKERMMLCRGAEQVNRVKLLHSGEYVRISELKLDEITVTGDSQILNEVLKRLETLGEDFHPIVYEYKHKVLSAIGYSIVKCYIPALFPIYLSEDRAAIKSKRLGTYSCASHCEVVSRLNTFPHPFP